MYCHIELENLMIFLTIVASLALLGDNVKVNANGLKVGPLKAAEGWVDTAPLNLDSSSS